MSSTNYLAVDLGAESGRVILGTLNDGRLALGVNSPSTHHA
jgi:hypothetical protein